MPDLPPITLEMTGKLFLQFEGGSLIEVASVTLPFTVAVVAGQTPSDTRELGDRG